MTDITSSDDIIDVRDVIARVEELREEKAGNDTLDMDGSEIEAELAMFESLLDNLKGYGGDEQWEGDWYPVSLIRDSYFTTAMQELVEDIGDMPNGFPSYIEIDWDATARNLQVDYSSVEFEGVTYWYR